MTTAAHGQTQPEFARRLAELGTELFLSSEEKLALEAEKLASEAEGKMDELLSTALGQKEGRSSSHN